ncbi:MAG: hypothetical protein JW889_00165 [Verrucomicrobia bacterium]|nr:hypothetical protein [Verrucomicrobiota bacterium]
MARVFCVSVLIVGALVSIGGCDGDSSSGSLLAQGTATVTSSSTVLATLNIDQPGTLRGVIVWSGAPTELAIGFKHVASATTVGMALGSSPTSSTVAVTSARVAAGTQWEVLAAAPSGPAVSVQFEVTFEAD